jgi:hypothetical protein
MSATPPGQEGRSLGFAKYDIAAVSQLLILICASHTPEPLDQFFKFLVADYRPALSHIDREDAPCVRGSPFLVDSFGLVALRTCTIKESFRFRI